MAMLLSGRRIEVIMIEGRDKGKSEKREGKEESREKRRRKGGK